LAAPRIAAEILFAFENSEAKRLECKAWQPLRLIHQWQWLGAQKKIVILLCD
jgi:hypothetical protein